jgi:hypothetical protein
MSTDTIDILLTLGLPREICSIIDAFKRKLEFADVRFKFARVYYPVACVKNVLAPTELHTTLYIRSSTYNSMPRGLMGVIQDITLGKAHNRLRDPEYRDLVQWYGDAGSNIYRLKHSSEWKQFCYESHTRPITLGNPRYDFRCCDTRMKDMVAVSKRTKSRRWVPGVCLYARVPIDMSPLGIHADGR